MDLGISRREMFKRAANKRSLRLLGILLPGGLEHILGIGDVNGYGSAEEAGLALGKRRRNGPPKLIWNTSSTRSDESKVATLEESAQDQGGAA